MKVLDFEYCKDWDEWPGGCTDGPGITMRKCWCRQAEEKRPIIIMKRALGYVVEWEEENLI